MTEQPRALRLATTPGAIIPVDIETTAMLATELRRLHEEVTEQGRLLSMSAERELALLARIGRLEKLNAELLEALKMGLEIGDGMPRGFLGEFYKKACVAIVKATGDFA